MSVFGLLVFFVQRQLTFLSWYLEKNSTTTPYARKTMIPTFLCCLEILFSFPFQGSDPHIPVLFKDPVFISLSGFQQLNTTCGIDMAKPKRNVLLPLLVKMLLLLHLFWHCTEEDKVTPEKREVEIHP